MSFLSDCVATGQSRPVRGWAGPGRRGRTDEERDEEFSRAWRVRPQGERARLGEGRIEDGELRPRGPVIRREGGRREVWLLGREAQCRMEFHPQPAIFWGSGFLCITCAHPELLFQVRPGVSQRWLGSWEQERSREETVRKETVPEISSLLVHLETSYTNLDIRKLHFPSRSLWKEHPRQLLSERNLTILTFQVSLDRKF